jgi:hypothetical protein
LFGHKALATVYELAQKTIRDTRFAAKSSVFYVTTRSERTSQQISLL